MFPVRALQHSPLPAHAGFDPRRFSDLICILPPAGFPDTEGDRM